MQDLLVEFDGINEAVSIHTKDLEKPVPEFVEILKRTLSVHTVPQQAVLEYWDTRYEAWVVLRTPSALSPYHKLRFTCKSPFAVRSAFEHAATDSGPPAKKQIRESADVTSQFFIVAPMYPNEYGFVAEAAILAAMALPLYDEILIFCCNDGEAEVRRKGFELYRAQIQGASGLVEEIKGTLHVYASLLDKIRSVSMATGTIGKIKYFPLYKFQGLFGSSINVTRVGLALVNHGTEDVFTCGTDHRNKILSTNLGECCRRASLHNQLSLGDNFLQEDNGG
eukprot:TRINITY_DN14841_c0_g1_i18.p1 TRINITY_DN14841_c0_g1~~TRINITY_DN14841_c0_g1_i18.p1  ORF type:complete len:280 (+),score=31.78 TRINITY_DN14841_c0_g1_i18:471-1310(+)